MTELQFDPFKHVWCARHSEPYREEYPIGFVVGTTMLIQKALSLESLQEEAGAELDAMMPLLLKKQACCRVDRDTLLQVYLESRDGKNNGAWRSYACEVCHEWRRGARYSVTNPLTRQVESFRHICFECVLDRMRPVGQG